MDARETRMDRKARNALESPSGRSDLQTGMIPRARLGSRTLEVASRPPPELPPVVRKLLPLRVEELSVEFQSIGPPLPRSFGRSPSYPLRTESLCGKLGGPELHRRSMGRRETPTLAP